MMKNLSSLCAVFAVCLASVSLADEYPQVIRRNGEVCVQTLGADGKVAEACRPEGPVAAKATTTDESGVRVTSVPRAASLLDADPKGAGRGVAELFGGQVGALLPQLISIAVGGTSVAGTLLVSLASFGVSSLVSGLMHLAYDGQAGFGWAFLGNAIGQAVSLLISLVAITGASPVLLIVGILAGAFLPALGASIALELRDHALRENGGVARTPSSADPVVMRF